MALRTSNKDARKHVQNMEVFKGSNTFAEIYYPDPDGFSNTTTWRYAVYSYGYHFPMFVAEWLDGEEPTWYENVDKYSQSTSKQQSQLHPLATTTKCKTDQLRVIARRGIAGLVEQYANQ